MAPKDFSTMAETIERVGEGDKERIIAQAEDTPQFEAFRSFFQDEYGYEVADAGVIAVQEDEETYHLVTFRLEDDDDVRVEINITLHEGEVVSSKGTIESFEGDLIDEVDVFTFVDGEIRHEGTA